MAALSDGPVPEILDLRRFDADDLDALLEEETRVWKHRLNWDFRPSADLVRRFVRMQALSGFALCAGGNVLGYAYYVCEEQKGLVGDLYVMNEFDTVENENLLLAAALQAMRETPNVRRVESQLMMLRSPLTRVLPLRGHVRVFARNFMVAELSNVHLLQPGKASGAITVQQWSDRRQDEAAALISAAYHGHIDSEINDQYRSTAGARRFLTNIVQYPGCGTFHLPASYVAVSRTTGRLAGISLSSLVASDIGHITQICVAPSVMGSGVGYELMRRSLQALAGSGCRKASLTVTAENAKAVELYERVGFLTVRRFGAYVWDDL